MPKEVRFIVFSIEEVTIAVCSHLRARAEIPPDALVRIAEVRSTPATAVKVARVPRGHGWERWIEDTELAAAMIRHCIQRKVPLPARSQKWLEVRPCGLALGLAQGVSPQAMRAMLGQVLESLADSEQAAGRESPNPADDDGDLELTAADAIDAPSGPQAATPLPPTGRSPSTSNNSGSGS